MSKIIMIDVAIDIDERLLKKINKQIQEDASIPQDEKDLWNSVHLYPQTLANKFIQFLEEKYGKGSKS